MENGAYTLSTTFLQSLLHKEENATLFANLPTYNDNCERVTSVSRDREAQWICRAGRRLGLSLNTIGSAVSIFDRVLSVVSVRFKYVNCVALTALYLAVKLHEECFSYCPPHPPTHKNSSTLSLHSDCNSENESVLDANYFLQQLNVSYTLRELNRMEGEVLRILDWDLLMLPSCARFIEAMLAVIGAPHLIESSALRENFEAVVSNWSLVGYYRSSTLALTLVSLMLQATLAEWPRVTKSLKEIFKINDLQFISCRSQMTQVLRAHHSHLLEAEVVNGTPSAVAPSTKKFSLAEISASSNVKAKSGGCSKGSRRKRKSRRSATRLARKQHSNEEADENVVATMDDDDGVGGRDSAYGSMGSVSYKKLGLTDLMRYTTGEEKLDEMDEDVFEVLYKIVTNVQQN